MSRTLVIAVALAGLAGAPASALAAARAGGAGSQHGVTETTLLMPGVTYTREVDFTPHGPVVLDVVTGPRPDGSIYTLAPALSNGTILGTEKLTDLEKDVSTTATTVGVNGDYFAANPGSPSGIQIRGGSLESAPSSGRSSLGIAPDGTLTVARVAFDGTWRGTDQRRQLDLNVNPVAGHTTLYTSAWGPATPAESGVQEAVIQSLPQVRPNAVVSGAVTQVSTQGPTPIPPGGAVLVSRGAQAPHLAAEAPVGTTVELRLTLTPNWSSMAAAIGGGPALVTGGRAVFRTNEVFGSPILTPRVARSAVGQLADGRILLVAVEGDSAAYSVGMTNYELAVALQRLGAVNAMALGSGTGSALAFDGTLLTRPSSGTEQPLSNALLLSYAGVYAPPPATEVLSPNGDGVDDTQTFSYKLVRQSQVTATVSGPDGSASVLASESEAPGVHELQWDGRNNAGAPATEGDWRFTVTAVDDQGRTTTAERTFSLNDTLGALQTAPTAASLAANATATTASFQLGRPAKVTVTIETRAGIVIATPLSKTLPAGPQRVAWDGRAWTGKLAFTGAYQVHVIASNAIGKASLVVPFVARRP